MDRNADIPETPEKEKNAKNAKNAKKKSGKQKKPKKSLYDYGPENDIKYLGPLSYRSLKIIAWLCLVIAQVGAMLALYARIFDEIVQPSAWSSVLSFFLEFVAPLFLLANFGTILSAHEGYKRLIAKFGIFAAGIAGVFFLLYGRYIDGILTAGGDTESARQFVAEILLTKGGFVAFNIFIDLLLCTLFMFFLMYRPQRVFVGGKLKLFRLMALLPVGYEVTSIVLKILAGTGVIRLSVYSSPFLTTKPVFGFIAFIALALFIKKREHSFIKKGRTCEEYETFLHTRANSLHFSVFTALTFVIAALADLIVAAILSAIVSYATGGGGSVESIEAASKTVEGWGFGEAIPLIFIAPVALLFSYTRNHKNSLIDILIPVAGIAAVALVYVEAGYQIFRTMATL